jgi:hypothetical protein
MAMLNFPPDARFFPISFSRGSGLEFIGHISSLASAIV